MSERPEQPQQPRSEFHGFSVFSPFVVLIERYAARRREDVVRKRGVRRDRYNTGDPVEVVGADGSVTRVISVEPIPAENLLT